MPSTTTNETGLTDLASVPGGEKPTIDPESADALDALFAQATVKPDEKADESAPEEKPDEKAAPTAEEKPEAEEKPPVAEETSEPVAEEKPAPVTDSLDSVELPPYTKPKTGEAFAQVKAIARERIASVEKERDALKAQIAELEGKVSQGLPPETEKELSELREFRQKLDVEAHPSFKSWDAQITQNTESIYAKLKAAGVAEASIKKIQELGGPSEVDWEPLAAKLPSQLKRYIEGKIYENEDLGEKKRVAMEDAKRNASEFLRTQSQSQTTAARKEYESFLPRLKWFNEQSVAPTATPEEKAAAETHNKFVKETRQLMDETLNDDSPKTRAILAIGYAQLQKTKADYDALVAASKTVSEKHQAEVTQVKTEVTSLKAELKKAKEFIAKIKGASTANLDTSAPSGDARPRAKADLSEHGGDAIDRLLKETLASRE